MMPWTLHRQVLLLTLGIVIFGCTPTYSSPEYKQKGRPNYSLTPILFVHGSGLNSQTWHPMMQHLVRAGYPPEYLKAIDLEPNNGANVRAAEIFIAPAVNTLLDTAKAIAQQKQPSKKPPDKVDIVAHSMGAVSSRWYTAKMRPERVRTWLALAGANHGSNAICPYPSDGNNEICPAYATSAATHPVQVALNGTPSQPKDETPYGLGRDRSGIKRISPDKRRQILYLTVRIDPDEWIKPEKSALIDGAGGLPLSLSANLPIKKTSPGNYLFTAKVGHDPLLQHPELIRLVWEMLSKPRPQQVKS